MNDQNEAQTTQTIEPPQAPASEAAYLGAMLAGHVTLPILDDDEFRGLNNQLVHEVARKRLQRNEPFAVSLLVEDLTGRGDLTTVGGATYLEKLASTGQSISAEVADEHARIIRQKATARSLMVLAQDLIADPGEDVGRAITQLVDKANTLQYRLSVSKVTTLTDAGTLRRKFGAQKWLWEGYIPIGHVTALVAQQGQGKSNVALDICHRLITGAGLPDGQQPGIRFNEDDRILYLDSEGFLQGLLARLEAWGTPDDPFIWPEGCDEKRWTLNTPTGWQEFESIVAQFRPKLVIIDSLSAANSLEEKDNDQMKLVLLNLNDLAKKFQIALIVVHHLRKAGVGEPSYPIDIDRVRGASTITQFPRIVLAIGTPDRTQETSRRLDVIKCNLCAFYPPLGFEIMQDGLAWGDAPEPVESVKAAEKVRQFFRDAFRYGKRRSSEALEEALAQGISKSSFDRAKACGVHCQKIGKVWYMGWPNQFSEEDIQDIQEPQDTQVF